ncbi:MAG TPA: hypothetical protein VK066_04825 [Chloroflexota bacterium]|nr:hypothetical protein [Chloroflexota bacterium]
MRELCVVLLIIALSLGGLELLAYALRLPLASGLNTADGALVPAPAVSSPSLVCPSRTVDYYARIGLLQQLVPLEPPCD